MARVTYGSFVTEINGSIGGTTFQRNAHGFTAKNKPNMVRPWTDYQKNMQNVLSQCISAWRNITVSERSAWESWATGNPQYSKHNPSRRLSGYSCFVKWHFYQFLSHQPVVVSPITPIPSYTPPVLQINHGPVETYLTITSTFTLYNWMYAIFMSPPLGETANFCGSRIRFLHFVEDTQNNFYFDSFYYINFGVYPQINDRIQVDIIAYNVLAGFVKPVQSQILRVLG
jgi:hypothetical protein